jgi:hypothetical protein
LVVTALGELLDSPPADSVLADSVLLDFVVDSVLPEDDSLPSDSPEELVVVAACCSAAAFSAAFFAAASLAAVLAVLAVRLPAALVLLFDAADSAGSCPEASCT